LALHGAESFLKAAALRVASENRLVDELARNTVDIRIFEAEEGFHERVDDCVKHF
jgi:hypothetical protein